MATQPPQNPVPSESPRDLKFNAGKIDELVTPMADQYIDRFGNVHYTIEGLKVLILQTIYDYGWQPVDTFQDGTILNNPNSLIQDETTGIWYRWDDPSTLPKMVAPNSTPESTGGISKGAWQAIDVNDVLRRYLASGATGKGDALIALLQPVTGAISKTQHDVNAERISALDFGIKNDGVTDNVTAIRSALIACAAASKEIYFPCGIYLCSDYFPIPSFSRIFCSPGAIFKLTGQTTLGGLVITGMDNNLKAQQCEDVETLNLTINCSSIAEENGISGLKCKQIRHYNSRIINALYHPARHGGRTFQFEGDIAEDVSIFSPGIENCSIGIN